MMANDTPTGQPSSESAASRWSQGNWVLITVFTGLTVVGVAISTGAIGGDIVDVSKGGLGDGTVRTPLFVYLYATLGALGYIFTKLMTGLEEFDEWDEIQELVEMGLRIPAAWVLAAGTYLLYSSMLVGDLTVTPQLAAGMAFLVGLYVNVALKGLGSLADRILGRSSQ